MADGSVTYQVKVDDTQAQAELNHLNSKIKSLQDSLEKQGRKKGFLEERLADIKAQYDAAIAADNDPQAEALEKEYDKVANSIKNVNQQMELTRVEIDAAKEKAGQLSNSLVDAGQSGKEGGEAAASAFDKLEKRIVGLVKRVFVFSVITRALRTLKTWLSNTVKTNQEAASAMAQLKGALYELAAPILNVIIPAFIWLVRVVTLVVKAISSLINTLFGRTAAQASAAAQALYDEQNALDGVGGAAKDAAKSLANFDEIQKLTDESAGGGGGGGGGDGIAPDFNFDDSWIAGLAEKFAPEIESIKTIFRGLGDVVTAILNGDIAGAFSGLGTMIQGFGRLCSQVLGRVGAGIGTFGTNGAKSIGKLIDKLQEHTDVDLSKIKEKILLGINFISLDIEGFCIKTGWLIEDLCDIVGHLFKGEWEEAWDSAKRLVRDAKIDTGKYAYEMAVAITENMMEGKESTQDLGQAFINLLTDVRNSVPATEDEIDGLTDSAVKLGTDGKTGVEDFGNATANSAEKALTPLQNFWEKLKNILATVQDLMGIKVGGGLLGLISGQGWSWDTSVNGLFGMRSTVPALATGGVIPPNREFLAVLGDQKQGTNIEAPLETIVDAFRRVMGEGNGQPIILQLDRRELGRAVVDVYGQETQRVGIQLGGA